jgi:hypothetical protein
MFPALVFEMFESIAFAKEIIRTPESFTTAIYCCHDGSDP